MLVSGSVSPNPDAGDMDPFLNLEGVSSATP